VLTLPVVANTLDAESNISPGLAPALPLKLYNTCVFAPGTTKLPEILPTKLPTKNY
jgi:hypothetical protein